MASTLKMPSYQTLEDWWYKSNNAWNRIVVLIFHNGPTCSELEADFVFKPKNKATFLDDYTLFHGVLNRLDLEHNFKIAACAKMFSTFMELTEHPDHLHTEEPRRLSVEETRRRMEHNIMSAPILDPDLDAQATKHEDKELDRRFRQRLDERNHEAMRQNMLERLQRGEAVDQP